MFLHYSYLKYFSRLRMTSHQEGWYPIPAPPNVPHRPHTTLAPLYWTEIQSTPSSQGRMRVSHQNHIVSYQNNRFNQNDKTIYQNNIISHQNLKVSHPNNIFSHQNKEAFHQNNIFNHQYEGVSHQNIIFNHQNKRVSHQNERQSLLDIQTTSPTTFNVLLLSSLLSGLSLFLALFLLRPELENHPMCGLPTGGSVSTIS